ncbi:TPA: hypothetical protein ACYYZU_002155, partial [Staphylococcus aureus]|nr:hypothetical protein [Staphylococcus aureus]MDT4082497.1 hypothetical protein [Staphylococcus aureus]MDT4193810.1 hypothetical protein [Staphylococcus aureus]
MKKDTYQSYLFYNSEEPVHNGLRIIVCKEEEGYMRRAHEKNPLTTKSCKEEEGYMRRAQAKKPLTTKSCKVKEGYM